MLGVYYNENDKQAAAWLRELMRAGQVPEGFVDTRSIEDVAPEDIIGFSQHHFFAGIGGWPLALRLAGWPDDRAVWTGSCPCQPFSAAGSRKGVDDERHLWPAFRWLIDQRRPATVFGEQVASKAGRGWLAGVRADLEAMGYGVGAADLCAAGVGAPHIRQRLWWVADSGGRGFQMEAQQSCVSDSPDGERQPPTITGRRGTSGGDSWQDAIWTPCADGKARRIEPGIEPLVNGLPGRVGLLRGYGNAIVPQVAEAFITAYLDTLKRTGA